MTSEELIAEGRRLQRPCVFLRPKGSGDVAGVWYERDQPEIASTGYHCWLSVDARQVPGLPSIVSGCLSISTNEEECEGGRVQVTERWPKRAGTQLYAHTASVLPPLEAVFLRGGDAVGEWLQSLGWQRDWGYNGNFKDKAVTRPYWDVLDREFPMFFDSDVYAMLGGWHFPGQDGDWKELLNEHLLATTFRDSEPWVEAWFTRTNQFRVIQRIT